MRWYTRFINLRQFPPGRLRIAAEGVRAEATNLGDAPLVALCVRTIEDAGAYLNLRARRRAQRGGRFGGEARRLDQRVDGAVSGMHQTLLHTTRADAGTPLAGVAQAIIDGQFPDGTQAITALPYEEELISVEQIVARLRADFGPHLDDLNLTGWLRRLDELLPAYRDALAREVLITGTDLINARARMQHDLQRIVAHVLGQYGGEGEAEKRAALLSPVEDQEDRLIAMLARRRSGQRTSLDIPAVIDPAGAGAEPMDEDEALFAEEDEVDVDAEPLGDGLLPDPSAP